MTKPPFAIPLGGKDFSRIGRQIKKRLCSISHEHVAYMFRKSFDGTTINPGETFTFVYNVGVKVRYRCKDDGSIEIVSTDDGYHANAEYHDKDLRRDEDGMEYSQGTLK